MKLVLIGNEGSRRIRYTLEALVIQGFTDSLFISYSDIYHRKVDLTSVLPDNGCIRLESPSEDSLFEAQLSEYYSNIHSPESLSKGVIYNFRTWYTNYSGLLQLIEKAAQLKNCSFINHPDAISLTFDKFLTKEILSRNDIPCTPLIGCIDSYNDLQHVLFTHNLNRAFLKPRYGSSASGVIAFIQNKNKVSITTTVELDESSNRAVLFNNLKLHTYNSPQSIKIIIDTLCKYGVVVEKWVPKNFVDNTAFDLRIFVIHNQVQQVVVRTSKTVITNLHLGNGRGNMDRIIAQYPNIDLQRIYQVALDAVNCFPGLFYAGVDVILTGSKCSPYVVEVNCFGDMLLGDLCNGRSTYDLFAGEFENKFLSNGYKTH